MKTDRTSELNFVENPVVKVEGTQTPAEAAAAAEAGKKAPMRLSFDDKDPEYDAQWCRMVRDIQLNGEPMDNVISFDVQRGHIAVKVLNDKGGEEFEYRGPAWGGPDMGAGHLHYRRRDLVGHVTVKFGIPVESKEDRQARGLPE